MVVAAVAAGIAAPVAQARQGCASRVCEDRVIEKHKRLVVRPWNGLLDRIARCESGGRWWVATGNGFYGGLQFTLGTWRSVGGRGMPHEATRLEQKYRAVRVIHSQGLGAWPVCRWAA
jgi:hypothetical protein